LNSPPERSDSDLIVQSTGLLMIYHSGGNDEAGIVDVPEASPHTSVTVRVEHVKAQGRTGDLEAAGKGSVAVRQAHDVAGSNAAKGLEDSHGLCPIEDRRRLDSSRGGTKKKG
jgi:hypothetical protein